MVLGAFPMAKLGFLAVRQMSRPIANAIKAHAKDHPIFRNYICMPPAQFYNWTEVKIKMWTLHLGKPIRVPPLTESMAVELGAHLLGEFVLFATAAAVMILEYVRQTAKDAKKQANAKLERDELINKLAEMSFRLERQDAQIRAMSRKLGYTDIPEEVEEQKKEKSIKIKEEIPANISNAIKL